MITTPEEYASKLRQLNDLNNQNDPRFRVPENELMYKIDLNKRSVDALKIVTVATDHKAETIYFVADRYFDSIDLSETTCVIQYINAKNEGAIYPVPYYDIQSQEGKIIFPWLISGTATVAPGTIRFAIKFFKVKNGKLIFDLNTVPQTYNISYGMDIDEEIQDSETDQRATILQEFSARMDAMSIELQGKNLYWEEAPELPQNN